MEEINVSFLYNLNVFQVINFQKNNFKVILELTKTITALILMSFNNNKLLPPRKWSINEND